MEAREGSEGKRRASLVERVGKRASAIFGGGKKAPEEEAAAAGSAKSRAAMWDQKQAAADAESKANPFSNKYDGGTKLKKGDAGYGTAVAGSATAARAAKAQEWVENEIEKLLTVIAEHGELNGDKKVFITFGKLFEVYADISDTLVGILMRARKRKRLTYDGDMLFQGAHDNVVVTIM